MRYTDVDELLKRIPYEEIVSRFAVANAPIADVAPVRHARWVYHESVSSDDGLIGVYECSNCHAPVSEAVFDLLMDGFHKDYCGACGAKMDGKENEK